MRANISALSIFPSLIPTSSLQIKFLPEIKNYIIIIYARIVFLPSTHKLHL